jgi:hypothetical protein
METEQVENESYDCETYSVTKNFEIILLEKQKSQVFMDCKKYVFFDTYSDLLLQIY